MARKQQKFAHVFPNLWQNTNKQPAVRWAIPSWRRSLILFALLFVFSMTIQPAIAKVTVSSPVIHNQQPPYELVKQGKILYEAGRFQEAARVWQQVASAFATLGDDLNQAMALSNLSSTLQQVGLWEQARTAITQSLNLLETQKSTPEQLRILAQTKDIEGQLQLAVGQAEEAIDTWQQAADNYARIGNKQGLTQSRINQAQVMQDLGLYPRACKILLQTLELDYQDCKLSDADLQSLKGQPPSFLKVVSLRSLGNVLQVVGNSEQSQEILSESLNLAKQLNSPPDIEAAYISLGNAARAKAFTEAFDSGKQTKYREAGLYYYSEAAKISTSPTTQLFAQVNQLSLFLESEKWSEAEQLWLPLRSKLNDLPLSKQGIYAQINLVHSLLKLVSKKVPNSQLPTFQDIDQILITATEQAQRLGDRRTYAYALGVRGKLYENNQLWPQAADLTKQALNVLVSNLKAPDVSYELFWQLGRIYKSTGDIKTAIANYTEAVNLLQSMRQDLLAVSSKVQYSFKESVEPVYRELVELLLPSGKDVEQSVLIQARNLIESLQLAELDNFFRDACLNAKPVKIDQLDPTSAVFYTIILPRSLEIIVALPGQSLRHYSHPISQQEIEASLNQFQAVVTNRIRKPSLESLEKVYNWLIKPIELELASSQVKTLVFVLDGALRNIPIAALHDGQQYLMKKYSIALTPGLQLLEPKPLKWRKIQALTAGLTEPRQGFAGLPNVELELQRIKNSIPTQIILNQSFTNSNFQTKVKNFSFPVVHLATHGEFSSQAENTFILTWDKKINAKELDTLLRSDSRQMQPIELLVLSACRTASGDQRAALGLAGIAVRAGTRTTVASLWSVNDEATALFMSTFYQELANPEIMKVEALRRAQQTVLQDSRFSHPYYWAAFVLVGNWL
ncbi:CHAT domain-containing protein [Desmonostoc muscorum LEGE 12446]|uniref:CHAT domain-containing protein n=1 Tax=Desmonostoc muscorum LEGE 12446 TaxID=1828758 RepID=A0A8J6ZHQ7_DESMC|nr:CHAT domain-containing protein [Desmonostoc muscorum]MCF2146575.1 CHAT domain-containing protein [Desmonostoc muscorum LEGE 12446]